MYILWWSVCLWGGGSQMSLFDEDQTGMVTFERENFYTDHDYDNDDNDNCEYF